MSQAKNEYYTKKLQESKSKIKSMWEIVNSVRKNSLSTTFKTS